MDSQFYRKQGRKYIKVGFSDGFTGFPTDGVWLVQAKPGRHSSECLLKLGELPELYPFIQMAMAKDDLIKFLAQKEEDYRKAGTRGTLDDRAKDILKFLSTLNTKKK
jgi:hypothetical protein